MRIGVLILPTGSWPAQRRRWAWIEEHGAAHGWTFDHLVWRRASGQPWFGAVPVLTVAALATNRITLGPLVSSPNFRLPVPFAKELLTVDDMSGGRLIVGVGAGAAGFDAQPVGYQRQASQFERFSNFTAELHKLLGASSGSPLLPGPHDRTRVPLAVAATRPRGLRLAARYADLWVTNGFSAAPGVHAASLSLAEFSTQLALLERACIADGRPLSSLRRLVSLGNPVEHPVAERHDLDGLLDSLAGLGCTDAVLPYPVDDDPAGLVVLERAMARHADSAR